jgi:hypothetical protein
MNDLRRQRNGNMHFLWLIAKADIPWPRIVSFVIMFLIYPAYKALKRQREEQAKSPRSRVRPPSNPNPSAKSAPVAARPAAPQKTDPLLAEIQKYLKQSSADKRSRARSQRSGAKPPRVEPVLGGGPAVGDSVGRPLDGRHLETAEFGARASRLTDDLKRGDAEREQHFQQTFDHKLGRLTDTSVAGAKAIAPPAPAAAAVPTGEAIPIDDWLPLPTTEPEDLRRALMMNEILRRPEHRW